MYFNAFGLHTVILCKIGYLWNGIQLKQNNKNKCNYNMFISWKKKTSVLRNNSGYQLINSCVYLSNHYFFLYRYNTFFSVLASKLILVFASIYVIFIWPFNLLFRFQYAKMYVLRYRIKSLQRHCHCVEFFFIFILVWRMLIRSQNSRKLHKFLINFCFFYFS